MNWSLPVGELRGVGEKRAESYARLGVTDLRSLLYHLPRDYVDYTSPVPVLEAELEQPAVIRGTIIKKLREARIRRGLVVFKALAADGPEEFTVVIFNNHFAFDALREDETYYFYGKVTGNLTRREIHSPQILPADAENLMQPQYPLTEGLTNAMLMTNMKQALSLVEEELYDFMPKEVLQEHSLCTLRYALENVHFPPDAQALEIARKRLAFDELLTLQLGLLLLKGRRRQRAGCPMNPVDMGAWENSLPFPLTGAQKRAIGEISGDMRAEIPMNRLLQGDVGSGKTAVAAAACYFAYQNGCQSALMAPTEILASQHFQTLDHFLTPLGAKVCLLTGSLTPKQKRLLREELAAGTVSVAVGTHALVQDAVEFHRLGLVITDEQHRFGVGQRAALAGKGENPHTLVMSATPIPRTLGLILYGDLDISILDEMPKGRLPVQTYAVTGKLRPRAYQFVRRELDMGHQGYVVCPMIEENDTELQAVTVYEKKLSEGEFRDYRLGLLHGRMSSQEKEQVMERFQSGEIQLLISTTVVEVGVDVSNASIILIEDADRFGLSQLHQLRGRVGRGGVQSHCVLVTDHATEEVRQRMKIMCSTTDGFQISEEDMKLRGCGDFFGQRQHGLPPLKVAVFDSQWLAMTQQAARKLLELSPDLGQWPALKEEIERLFADGGPAA